MVNKKKVGVLFGRHPNRGFAQVDGGSEASDFTGVRDLQPVHRLRSIGDFFGDAEIVVEIMDEGVQSHL